MRPRGSKPFKTMLPLQLLNLAINFFSQALVLVHTKVGWEFLKYSFNQNYPFFDFVYVCVNIESNGTKKFPPKLLLSQLLSF